MGDLNARICARRKELTILLVVSLVLTLLCVRACVLLSHSFYNILLVLALPLALMPLGEAVFLIAAGVTVFASIAAVVVLVVRIFKVCHPILSLIPRFHALAGL